MLEQYAKIRRFLSSIFQPINFQSTQSGKNVYNAIKFLHSIEGKKKQIFIMLRKKLFLKIGVILCSIKIVIQLIMSDMHYVYWIIYNPLCEVRIYLWKIAINGVIQKISKF